MGAGTSVYMANASEEDIFVMAALDPKWILPDVFLDIGALYVGIGELKSAITVADLPEDVATIADLFAVLKIGAKLLSGTLSVGSRPVDAAVTVLDAFKKVSIPIGKGQYKDVKDASWLNYFNADGIAGLLGAETVSVLVVSGDGKQVALYETGSDDSWIATDRQLIVRSKYGSIWEEDPNAGTVAWPVGGA